MLLQCPGSAVSDRQRRSYHRLYILATLALSVHRGGNEINGRKNGRLSVAGRVGFWANLAKCQWLLRTLPEKKSPPAGLANHGGQGIHPDPGVIHLAKILEKPLVSPPFTCSPPSSRPSPALGNYRKTTQHVHPFVASLASPHLALARAHRTSLKRV